MSLTSRTSRIAGGLLHRAPAWVFLAFSLGLNVRLGLSQVGLASRNPLELERGGQGSDSVLGQSQQSEQGTSPASAPKPVLTDGTPVRLKLVRAVVSSRVIAGEKVPLEVIEPVLVGNLIAIPQHTQAEAIVTMAQPRRSMGRGGNLELKMERIRLADGEAVPVRAVRDVKGGERKAVAIAVWSVWPFAVKGKNATVPAGTEITAYITGDFPLDPSKFQTTATSLQGENAPK